MSDAQYSYQSWLEACMPSSDPSRNNLQIHEQSSGKNDPVAISLRQEARLHFEVLSSSKSSQSIESSRISTQSQPRKLEASLSAVEQDVSEASCSTPNGALALLVSVLGPVFSLNKSIPGHNLARFRALNCLTGALEGSLYLTFGVRQAVGHFLVELCRPDHRDDDDKGSSDGRNGKDFHGVYSEAFVDSSTLSTEETSQKLQALDDEFRQTAQVINRTDSVTHEDIRDTTVACLKALLQSRLEMFPTSRPKSNEEGSSQTLSSPSTEAMNVLYQSAELRIKLANHGVRYRCDSEVENPYDRVSAGSGYDPIDSDFRIEDGLSKLPQMRRSICFTLLEGALNGLEVDLSSVEELRKQFLFSERSHPSFLLKVMSEFAILVSSCLYGETDPRCLLQLLRLLNRVQQVMLPRFSNDSQINVSEKEISVAFPSIQIFDAVAPYYPVHFTPPKNDPHGITKELLQNALMDILCEKGTIYKVSSKSDIIEAENMITLSARLFLERLDPPASTNYDSTTNEVESEEGDKLAAVNDLSILFLSSSDTSASSYRPSEDNKSPTPSYSSNVMRVPPVLLSELSSSLARVHEEAVSSDNATYPPNHLSLASAVRQFSTGLAYSLELSTISSNTSTYDLDSNTARWKAFVLHIINRLSPTLASSPQGVHGRASTAYLASLAAGSGVVTLNKVLEESMPRFLSILSTVDEGNHLVGANDDKEENMFRDEEKLTAAMRGSAAMMSSCRVVLERLKRNNGGARVHPHPLSPYISSSIRNVASILDSKTIENNDPLSLAAIGVMESMLTSFDLRSIDDEDMVLLESKLSLISKALLSQCDSKIVTTSDKPNDEWKEACARMLGAVISVGISQEENGIVDETSSSCKMMLFAKSLLSQVISAAISYSPPPKFFRSRYDWIILANACANGELKVSFQIVSDLLSHAAASLRSSLHLECTPLLAFSYVIRHGGPHVGAAFHMVSSHSDAPIDIIHELCQPMQKQTPGTDEKVLKLHPSIGMSHLKLPTFKAAEEEEAHTIVEKAYTILPLLIPAYDCPSSSSSCGHLVQLAEKVLPPLSGRDEVKLCVIFPLLAAILTNSNKMWDKLNNATIERLISIKHYLVEYIMSSDHDKNSRSAAASCLFSILCYVKDENNSVRSMSQTLLNDGIFAALVNSMDNLQKDLSEEKVRTALSPPPVKNGCFSRVQDILNCMGIVGSAAACKGGSHSKVADAIALFLVELACVGSAMYPFTETPIKLITPSEKGQKHPIRDLSSLSFLIPASAFGNMLSVHKGGSLWRQRMMYKTLPVLMCVLQGQAQSQNPPALGSLGIVCHILCCLPASLIGESNVKQMIPTLVAGLVYFSKNIVALAESEKHSLNLSDFLAIILAALIKIFSTSPDDVLKFTGIIIPSLLLLCAPNDVNQLYIPKQLLVLQCLEMLTQLPSFHNKILSEKDQVLAISSMLVDHPSKIVRQAVVQVRNAWFIL